MHPRRSSSSVATTVRAGSSREPHKSQPTRRQGVTRDAECLREDVAHRRMQHQTPLVRDGHGRVCRPACHFGGCGGTLGPPAQLACCQAFTPTQQGSVPLCQRVSGWRVTLSARGGATKPSAPASRSCRSGPSGSLPRASRCGRPAPSRSRSRPASPRRPPPAEQGAKDSNRLTQVGRVGGSRRSSRSVRCP